MLFWLWLPMIITLIVFSALRQKAILALVLILIFYGLSLYLPILFPDYFPDIWSSSGAGDTDMDALLPMTLMVVFPFFAVFLLIVTITVRAIVKRYEKKRI